MSKEKYLPFWKIIVKNIFHFAIINIASNVPKYPSFFILFFIKSALMWNGYTKFGGGYFCPKNIILLVLKYRDQFCNIE